jgi:hypothetical protein
MVSNLLRWLPYLDPEDLDNIASAARVPNNIVALLPRERALATLREIASLRFLRVGAAALATLRKLKIKPRVCARHERDMEENS